MCVYVFASKGNCEGKPDGLKYAVYQHSFMLLVLDQPERGATPLCTQFMCAALSNATIFFYFNCTAYCSFLNLFCVTNVAVMV